jgi:hypothetical protein
MDDKPRRGRPPLDPNDPSINISISLPSRQFDAYCKRALREGTSLPEAIRRQLARARSSGDDEE